MLLSICIPTYNRQKFIGNSLQFLLNDADAHIGKEVEILVSNNASTDGTDKIIGDIFSRSQRFSYFSQEENIGPMRNFCFLVENARAEYVWIVGDDDTLRPGIVEYILDLINLYKDEDLGALFLGASWIREDYALDKFYGNSSSEIWDALGIGRSIESGLHNYGDFAVSRYELGSSDVYDSFNFTTACIMKKNTLLDVYKNPDASTLHTAPYACSMNAVHNSGCFFVEPKVYIYAGIDLPWIDEVPEIYSLELLKSYLSLEYFRFTKSEIKALIKVFFEQGEMWLPVFKRNPMKFSKRWEFVKLVIKEGFLWLLINKITVRILKKIKRDVFKKA
ncbi:MAG: glycosyltransferase [Holosporaceae bacterium]|jgi:glycosyltransferase involved in cell wall biosynthesis|nr:glycosyltransferase [Holosporaceae bacterium]